MDERQPRDGERVRLEATVRGDVQGVGFRWWTQSQAEALGLAGHARNLPDGRVEVVVEGPRADVDRLRKRLERPERGRPGRVTGVEVAWAPPTGARRFETR